MAREPLPEGKIPPAVLERVLEQLGGASGAGTGAGTILGPAPGEDAAVVDPRGAPRLILAADPITFPSADPGWHSVIVNANDVAATGGEPRWFLSSTVAPPGTGEEQLLEVARGVARGCREAGAVPAGGHTEISAAAARVVVAGAMIGVATPERIKPGRGAREGDMLVITKGVAIEATAVVAAERGEEIAREFGAEFRDRCLGFLRAPGISVIPEARIAAGMIEVHAMHDVTEGGVATAIREMAEAAELGAVVAETEIPRFHESKRLMGWFGLDILGALGSGALLIACAEPEVSELLSRLEQERILARVIGRFVRPSEGILLQRGSVRRELPRFEVDELARLPPASSPP